MRGTGNVRGTIDTDRYGEIVCGYLAEKPITRRLRVVFSPLSRQDGSQAALDDSRISARFTRRVKKEKPSRTLPIARQRLTRLFEVRLPADNVGNPRCVLFPVRRAVTFDAIETYCASGYGREPNRFRGATNIPRRVLSYAP